MALFNRFIDWIGRQFGCNWANAYERYEPEPLPPPSTPPAPPVQPREPLMPLQTVYGKPDPLTGAPGPYDLPPGRKN